MQSKILAFEYFVYQLDNWYKEACGSDKGNDLSTLKVLKLLFFASAVGTNESSTNTLLDKVFNNFYAMPYGHVEGEIYSAIKKKETPNVSIGKYSTEIISSDFQLEEKELIDSAINMLKEENFDLIKMSSFDLVELSHSWFSWKYYFNKAKQEKIYSFPIPIDVIKSEEKIFSFS